MAYYMFTFAPEETSVNIIFEGPRATGGNLADYIIYETKSGDYVDSDSFTFDIFSDVYWEREFTGLRPGTEYTVEIFYDGYTYADSFETLNDRPSDFKWTYSKVQGEPVRVLAAEWNAFTGRINEFRTYKGLTAYSFTTAERAPFTNRNVGTEADGLTLDSPCVISKKILCEAVDAVNPMLSSGKKADYPTGLSAEFFNNIVEKLNSIT